MIELNAAEMEQLNGGGDFFICGVGAALTIGSLWYAPWASVKLAEITITACVLGQ